MSQEQTDPILEPSMELAEPARNTRLRHDYTANRQLISRPLSVENKELKDKK